MIDYRKEELRKGVVDCTTVHSLYGGRGNDFGMLYVTK
jgi:hypothetical protein